MANFELSCPSCGSTNIRERSSVTEYRYIELITNGSEEPADWEYESGELDDSFTDDTDLRCMGCDWSGDLQGLVAKAIEGGDDDDEIDRNAGEVVFRVRRADSSAYDDSLRD